MPTGQLGRAMHRPAWQCLLTARSLFTSDDACPRQRDSVTPLVDSQQHHAHTIMADNKENIADGLVANASFHAPEPAPSPKKTARKSRSKSIGPGGLGELDAPALKESNGNRRKSAFIPAVKSILSSNDEDEKKRREARRKSLGML